MKLGKKTVVLALEGVYFKISLSIESSYYGFRPPRRYGLIKKPLRKLNLRAQKKNSGVKVWRCNWSVSRTEAGLCTIA